MSKSTKSLADKLFPITSIDDEISIVNIPPEKRRLHTETYDFSIATLVDYLENGAVVMPKFQRKYVWNRSQASRLIESLIIQCPIPVIYLNQEQDETLSVIDGNQRLTSIKLFLQDDFPLQGLSAYPELEGNKFSDLDPRFRRHIRNRTLRCITILKETHPQIKFDVFERINTGAVHLNPQELRHGVYHGELIKALDEMSKEKVWRSLVGFSQDTRMKASELVLRYVALANRQEKYKKPLEGFLNDFCADFQNVDENSVLKWKSDFLSVVELINKIFGTKSFKVLDADLEPLVKNINAALLDAVMIGLTRIRPTKKQLKKLNKNDFLLKYQAVIQEPKFLKSITAGTSATASVNYRIDTFCKFLESEFE